MNKSNDQEEFILKSTPPYVSFSIIDKIIIYQCLLSCKRSKFQKFRLWSSLNRNCKVQKQRGATDEKKFIYDTSMLPPFAACHAP